MKFLTYTRTIAFTILLVLTTPLLASEVKKYGADVTKDKDCQLTVPRDSFPKSIMWDIDYKPYKVTIKSNTKGTVPVVILRLHPNYQEDRLISK